MRFGVSSLMHEAEFREKLKSGGNAKKLYLNYIDRTIEFTLKNDLGIIEICVTPNSSAIIFSILGGIKERIEVLDEVTLHLPWIGKSTEEIREYFKIAELLNIKILVIHPILTDPFIYGRVIDIERNEIVELISLCNKQDLIPCFENMPSEMPKFNRPDEFDYIVEKGGFLTLDVGHAVTCGIDPIVFIERFGDKVKHVHLQDEFKGKPDIHYAIGKGELDYVKFLNKLEEIDYKGIVMLELVSEDDVIESLHQLKDYL
jgi:sugar phosphate isomerase/epimerase